MKIVRQGEHYNLYKESERIGSCRCVSLGGVWKISDLRIAEGWRRRGYGSYLLKEVLRDTDGYARGQAAVHQVEMPADEAELAFWEKFGFRAEGGILVRGHHPDLTAVLLAQQFIAAHCPAPQLCIDATCGNGGDTDFLCGLAAPCGGRVLAMDIQRQACENTEKRLTQAGFSSETYHIICASHARLAEYAAPESADIILFNFGWLPGAEHAVFSTAESSLPALAAALTALKPGGLLSAILYSGKTIGSGEKAEILRWLRALPLEKYTVLVCDFANWADTAPLPCFVLKKRL